MSTTHQDFDASTVVGEGSVRVGYGKSSPPNPNMQAVEKFRPSESGAPLGGKADSLPFVDTSTFLSVKRPYCVPIGKGGVKEALVRLDEELVQAGNPGILSKKKPISWTGREVNPGTFGLYEYGSQPQILLEPGRYPGMPISNWFACTYYGTFALNQNFPPTHNKLDKIARLGLTIVQVSQNQAAVCMDPQNQVFVVADGGFVAMATSGAYKVLGLVDQTHLDTPVLDHYSRQVLGHMQVVKNLSYVAATFLDIPANNVAVLQRKDELFELAAGQHYLTTASVTIRGFYTKGEVQQELECDNIYTRDQVPVWLRMYLRYELLRPLELARHGYKTPFDSLQDKTRSILTQILAHLDYSMMAKSRNAAPELLADGTAADEEDPSSVFVSAVRREATDELKVVAAEYGIKLEDLAIIDRKFKGEIAAKMNSLTTRALEAQVESANLDRENANRRRKQEGDARVLELQNAMKRATAETEAANTLAAARARAEALTIQAEAEGRAIRLRADAEAEAVRIRGEADKEVTSLYAQDIAKRRVEVERTKAFGNRTVFAPLEAMSNGGVGGFAALGMLSQTQQPAK
ncbi:band 7 domain-containing protein [Atractiella rhizophila]|nr:band 7 domain-containing protein [Atractiella rhizophila]